MAIKSGSKSFFERLRKQLGNPTPATLKKRIQRKAINLGVTPREAIFVLAKENGVGYLKELKSLPSVGQIKITNTIQSIQPEKKRSQYSRCKLKPVILKTKFGSINEPFLSVTVKKDAQKMSEKAYLTLYIFENSIRNFINNVLEKEFGSNWWLRKMNTKKLSKIVDNVKKRLTKEVRIAWHGKRGAHPIYYSDFDDLITILEVYKNVFNKYINNQKGKAGWLVAKLYEVEPSRNIIAHHNPLSDRDFSRVEGNLMDWIKQLEFIQDKRLL